MSNKISRSMSRIISHNLCIATTFGRRCANIAERNSFVFAVAASEVSRMTHTEHQSDQPQLALRLILNETKVQAVRPRDFGHPWAFKAVNSVLHYTFWVYEFEFNNLLAFQGAPKWNRMFLQYTFPQAFCTSVLEDRCRNRNTCVPGTY